MKYLLALFLLTGCGTFNVSAPVTVPDKSQTVSTEPASGTSGVTAPAAPVVIKNLVWIDPDSGLAWQLVADSVAFSEAICPSTLVMPETTIPAKFADYLLQGDSTITGAATYWTPMEGTIGHIVRTIESDGENIKDADDSSLHLLICTEAG